MATDTNARVPVPKLVKNGEKSAFEVWVYSQMMDVCRKQETV
jgi:hypothetical protein